MHPKLWDQTAGCTKVCKKSTKECKQDVCFGYANQIGCGISKTPYCRSQNLGLLVCRECPPQFAYSSQVTFTMLKMNIAICCVYKCRHDHWGCWLSWIAILRNETLVQVNDLNFEEAEIMKTKWSLGYTGELDGWMHAEEQIEYLCTATVTRWLTPLITEWLQPSNVSLWSLFHIMWFLSHQKVRFRLHATEIAVAICSNCILHFSALYYFCICWS